MGKALKFLGPLILMDRAPRSVLAVSANKLFCCLVLAVLTSPTVGNFISQPGTRLLMILYTIILKLCRERIP